MCREGRPDLLRDQRDGRAPDDRGLSANGDNSLHGPHLCQVRQRQHARHDAAGRAMQPRRNRLERTAQQPDLPARERYPGDLSRPAELRARVPPGIAGITNADYSPIVIAGVAGCRITIFAGSAPLQWRSFGVDSEEKMRNWSCALPAMSAPALDVP